MEQARKFLGFDKRSWEKVKYSYQIYARNWIRDDDTHIYFEDTDENGQKWSKHVQEQIDRAIERFDDKRDDCLRILRDEYDYQTSDDAILESLRINDYLFDENGNIVR